MLETTRNRWYMSEMELNTWKGTQFMTTKLTLREMSDDLL